MVSELEGQMSSPFVRLQDKLVSLVQHLSPGSFLGVMVVLGFQLLTEEGG